LPLVLTDPRQCAGVVRRVAERLVDAWGGSAVDVDDELDHWREEVATETRRSPTVE
jgi:hypothetical protein